MDICQVTVGLLPIPPNGWGAVERIIWEYHCNSIGFNHNSSIKYLNDVNPNEYDIVHQHVANLALEGKKRGIDYIFSLHDHHVYVHGKNSETYRENLEAIDKSIITLVPCKFLISYFNNHPKLRYFPHGVNTDFFKPGNKIIDHKLLCVANNGFAHNQGFDRKGFSYAINAAKILDIPITIAGPSNNKKFFECFKQNYDKLTIKYDLDDNELLKLYQTHSIFLHPSILEAGHPNLTLLEAMACGLPVIATFEAGTILNGIIKIERDISQICKAIIKVIENYDELRNTVIETSKLYSFKNRTSDLLKIYGEINIRKNNIKKTNMKEQLIKIYNETPIKVIETPKNRIDITFLRGAKVEITGKEELTYFIEFLNTDTNKVEYSTEIKNNNWCKTDKEYYVNWIVRVYDSNHNLIEEKIFDPKEQHVFICLESSAIGDTLAWTPILEEFRKKHKCKLTVCTFNNNLFKNMYPEIRFVEPGEMVYDIYAMYGVGWYYNDNNEIQYNKTPLNFRLNPLQQTATCILGLEYSSEIKPRIHKPNETQRIKGKYVVIAPHASAHAKYWNNPNGWQDVINYLNDNGYKVVMITKEKLGNPWDDLKLNGMLENVIDKTGDFSLENRIVDIMYADLFIGLGSGLSWLSWALNTKTILISGFSYPYTEFSDCVRMYNNNVDTCTGCFNKYRLDPGNWDWCPEHNDTNRMYECTKQITSEEVINEIAKIIK